MENENNQVQSANTQEDVIYPDGWDGTTDLFEWMEKVANETDESPKQTEDTSTPEPEAEEESGTEESEEVPATDEESEEDGESATDEGEAPDTQQEPEPQSNKIKFDANINHKLQSVEIDQSELPELYEKAYAADKFRNKLNAKNAELEQAEVVSKLLGYDSVKDMLDAARKSYEETEVQKLVDEKVHPTIAKDTVSRRIRETEEAAAKNIKPVQQEPEEVVEKPKPGQRDFVPEVNELLQVYPELKGQKLPDEVAQAALKGERVLVAYSKYINKQKKADNDRLQKENKVLKQNAEAAKRAPVRGVAKGGATGETAEDPFLKGFNSI